MNKPTLLLLTLVTISIFSCQKTKEVAHEQVTKVINPLLGTWSMQSVHWETKDTTYSIDKAQPGMFIFTENSYSIQWTPIEEARVPFEDLSNPTDEELMAGFRSVVFNAGSCAYTDSTATATPMIAKVPGFEGGKQFYRYTIEGDLLHLTMFDETYPNGDKPAWFGRYVTVFVMKRVE